MSVRQLDAAEKRALAILGLPTAALALAIVSTYAPVVAQDFLSSTTVIGGRLPFMLADTPLAVSASRRSGCRTRSSRWARSCGSGCGARGRRTSAAAG